MLQSYRGTVDALRRKLETSSDLVEPWTCFHDELASSQEFLGLGTSKDHPKLWAIVAACCRIVVGRELPVTRRALCHVRELRLWHGVCLLGPHPVAVFYFDDLDQGLAALIQDPRGHRVELLRFSCVELPPGTAPILAPRSNQHLS
ncbi:MAG: hypothetical protein HY901_09730 [Deltaproteobacteria bacterium]|nr:hypothetical protein [Deltaproteobacteria bacterium]